MRKTTALQGEDGSGLQLKACGDGELCRYNKDKFGFDQDCSDGTMNGREKKKRGGKSYTLDMGDGGSVEKL